MQYRTTTPVPERLADDLAKNRITIRYRGEDGYEEAIEFEDGWCHLELVPRVVGRDRSGRYQCIPLKDVQAVEVDDELPARDDQHAPERYVYARWHRVDYGLWGELLRFVPQGNV